MLTLQVGCIVADGTQMMVETSSNITGTTTNPHNTDLTPGGSSGGEGAILALAGSLLGVGSDIGG